MTILNNVAVYFRYELENNDKCYQTILVKIFETIPDWNLEVAAEITTDVDKLPHIRVILLRFNVDKIKLQDDMSVEINESSIQLPFR